MEEEIGKCQGCNTNNGEELHHCPYREDIDGDKETLCNCCHQCTEKCEDDI